MYPNKTVARQHDKNNNVQTIEAASGRMGELKKRNSDTNTGRTNHVLICILECFAVNPLRRFEEDIVIESNELVRIGLQNECSTKLYEATKDREEKRNEARPHGQSWTTTNVDESWLV